MTDTRRMTTDRFYGGVSNRLQNLHSMLEYVRSTNPPRSELNEWVISNTTAGSPDAVSHHLTFLASIDLIELSEDGCILGDYGKQWLDDQNSETLYDALSSGVKGFDTILQALMDGSMTDEDIMELLVSEFDEAEMTKPGPAKRHREWLQVLGFLDRKDNINKITNKGLNLISENKGGDTYELYELPKTGETFLARIDRISNSGNGIVEWKCGQINVGPITEDSVGKVIEAEKFAGIYAICKTDRFKPENYLENFKLMINSVHAEPYGIKSSMDSTKTDSTDSSERKNSSLNNKELSSSSVSKNTLSSQDSNQETVEFENKDKTTKTEPQKRRTKNTVEDTNTGLSIDKLRKEAEEDAVEEVEQTTSTTTSTKPQYSRSSKVKDYVKARADGICEGCGEPAPFTSTTGEPYLHAHHVYELSNGGSDTPDTVVALCPNCHYRVHHGEDGDGYNQGLLEIVQEKEDELT